MITNFKIYESKRYDVGDYVVVELNALFSFISNTYAEPPLNMKGKIVDYMFNFENRIYMVEGFVYDELIKESFSEEHILRYMTEEEIEDFIPKYDLEKETDKYNL